ncbi:hypothetical protein ACWFQ8_06130 [Streptomyces sp. NPDC055254]
MNTHDAARAVPEHYRPRTPARPAVAVGAERGYRRRIPYRIQPAA